MPYLQHHDTSSHIESVVKKIMNLESAQIQVMIFLMQALFIGYIQNYLWKEKANWDMSALI